MTITNVLSATTQNVSASFTVTYEANNVNATVAVASRKQSQSNYTNATSNVSQRFYATSTTISNATLSANALALGFDGGNEVFERYAVYKFTFTNNNSNGGKGLDVSATFTRGTMSNFILLWIVSASEPTVSTTFSDNIDSWPGTRPYNGEVTPDNNGNFTVASNIGAGSSTNLYLYVAIKDVSLPISFTLGSGGSGSSLSFTLTYHANT